MIPFTTIRLTLDNNLLGHLTIPPGFLVLEKLSARSNLLTCFPDLRNIRHSLKKLHLTSNFISTIHPPFLDQLTALQNLFLGSNLLVSIPDVAGPGRSLLALRLFRNNFVHIPRLPKLGKSITDLRIGDNSINQISLEDIRQFPQLEFLGISNMTLTHLPNFCHFGQHIELVKVSDNADLVCDDHIRWFRLLRNDILEGLETTCIDDVMKDNRKPQSAGKLRSFLWGTILESRKIKKDHNAFPNDK
jgi:hypothetical protein